LSRLNGSHSHSSSPFMSNGLMCSQCTPSPVFPDLEAFRSHMKSHLISSSRPSVIPGGSSCPLCGTHFK
jgi:hypothetical protein